MMPSKSRPNGARPYPKKSHLLEKRICAIFANRSTSTHRTERVCGFEKLWLESGKNRCQSCLKAKGFFKPLFEIKLCWNCSDMPRCISINKAAATSYFSLNMKKVKKVIAENVIRLNIYKPFPEVKNAAILYVLNQLLGLVEKAFGKKKALEKELKVTGEIGTGLMRMRAPVIIL